FHAGVCQEILFKGWVSTTVWELIGSCAAIFLAGVLYEGLKYYREALHARATTITGDSTSSASYILMLVFMTYNVWLCIALVAGLAVGYFFFGWRKNTVVDVTEHCQ
ncbi:Copper transporter, partial [Operophtera brumata]